MQLSCERGPTLPPPNTESFRYNSYEWMDPITNTAIFLSETPSVLECAYLCNRVNIGKSTSTATSADQHSHTGHLLCSGFDYNFDNSKVCVTSADPSPLVWTQKATVGTEIVRGAMRACSACYGIVVRKRVEIRRSRPTSTRSLCWPATWSRVLPTRCWLKRATLARSVW